AVRRQPRLRVDPRLGRRVHAQRHGRDRRRGQRQADADHHDPELGRLDHARAAPLGRDEQARLPPRRHDARHGAQGERRQRDRGREFTLSGPGLGTGTVETSKAPVELTVTGLAAGTKRFRYWLNGNSPTTGDVTLAFLPNSWSYDLTTTTVLTAVTLGPVWLT